MKSAIKIILIFVFLLFAGKGFSQTAVQSGDTLRIRQQQMEQQKEQQKEQERLHQGEQQGQRQLGRRRLVEGVDGDFRLVRVETQDARPPMIVRPSGSGVPKGVGKPGGAGRKGGR